MSNLYKFLFKVKYKLIFFIAIKFKIWKIIENNTKGIGKTKIIHSLAKKYDLPVLTTWKYLYKDCEVITPTDKLKTIMKYSNQVILVDTLVYPSSLEVMYVLSKNNILVGFTSQVDFNRRDD